MSKELYFIVKGNIQRKRELCCNMSIMLSYAWMNGLINEKSFEADEEPLRYFPNRDDAHSPRLVWIDHHENSRKACDIMMKALLLSIQLPSKKSAPLFS